MRRSRSLWPLVLWACALAAFPCLVAAGSRDPGARRRLVLLQGTVRPDLEPRLAAELAAIGLVAQAWPSETDIPSALAADQVVAVVRAPEGAPVQLGLFVGREPTWHLLPDAEVGVSALRVAEMIRAAGLAPLPQAKRLPSMPSAAAPARKAQPRGGLRPLVGLGSFVMVSPGGVGPVWGANLLLGRQIERMGSLWVEGFLPLRHDDVSGPEGLARVKPWTLAVVLGWRLFGQRSDGLRLHLQMGLVGSLLVAEGQARLPYRGESIAIPSAGGLLALQVGHPIGPLVANLRLGLVVLQPRSVVSFEDRQVAAWGAPAIFTSFVVATAP